MDLNSYIVDDAGYLISTATSAKVLADSFLEAVEPLVSGGQSEADIFGEVRTAQEQRASVAARLRTLAEVALKLAAELESQQRNESDSQDIGYDAAHSIKE